jgi:hypothetical protein
VRGLSISIGADYEESLKDRPRPHIVKQFERMRYTRPMETLLLAPAALLVTR